MPNSADDVQQTPRAASSHFATAIRGSRYTAWLAAALIGLFLIVVTLEGRVHSPATDEPPHIAAGLSYFVTHQIFRADPQHPPLLKELSGLCLMAAGIRWPHTPDADYLVNGDDPVKVFHIDWDVGNEIIRSNGPDRALFWARMPMVLVAGLLAFFLYVWGRRLVGGVAAAGAVFLCVTDPTILAHSQYVTTDVGVAAFSVLALFTLWRYIERPDWTRLLLCGVCLGLALAAKYSAVLLLPVFGLLLLAAIFWPPAPASKDDSLPAAAGPAFFAGKRGLCSCGSGKQFKNCHGRPVQADRPAPREFLGKTMRATGIFAIVLVVAFLVVHATFFFPGDLTMYVKCARTVNADHAPDYQALMAGELRNHFTYYFLVAYLLKEPIPAIVLAAIGLAALFRTRSISRLGKLFLTLPPAVFFVGTSLLADDLGNRYLIPVLPFLHLAGGLGLVTLLQLAPRFKWAPWAAAALCAWALVAAAGVYPDHLSYFNEAACIDHPGRIGLDGGSRCGTEWLDNSNVDWGQSLKQLKSWLDRNAPGRQVQLASPWPFPAEAYGINYRPVDLPDLAREPAPGLYAISGHLVARIPLFGGSDWLRRVQPVAIVGHAIYIYDVPAMAGVRN